MALGLGAVEWLELSSTRECLSMSCCDDRLGLLFSFGTRLRSEGFCNVGLFTVLGIVSGYCLILVVYVGQSFLLSFWLDTRL